MFAGVLLSPIEDLWRADPLDDPVMDGRVGLLVHDDIGCIAAKLKAGINPPALGAIFLFLWDQIEFFLAWRHTSS